MRSILVIGGNSDIGYATAKVFAKNKFLVCDFYGNVSYAYTSGYFTLGNPNEDQYIMEQIVSPIPHMH